MSDASYDHYYYPLLHSIAFLLRLKLRYNRGQKLPGNIRIPFTKCLQQSRTELYEFLMSTPADEEIDPTKLGVLIHSVLIALLTARCNVADRIGHIFDITIPMALYRGNGIYRNASCATKYCAQMQYCLRSAVVHIVRHDGPLEPYTALDVTDAGIPSKVDDSEEAEQIQDLEELDMVDDIYVVRHSEASERPAEEPLCFVDDDDDAVTSTQSQLQSADNLNQGEDRLLV